MRFLPSVSNLLSRLLGPPVPRIAILWTLLQGAALGLSSPMFFQQPAYRLVAAAGMPPEFWCAIMLGVCFSLMAANYAGKPFLNATAMLTASAFLMLFGSTLAVTGIKYGVVSIGGWWTCYVAFRCMTANGSESWTLAS